MALPPLTNSGDLPRGVHGATLDEVYERFGRPDGRRGRVTRDLGHLYALAMRTGQVRRFIVFGSYVTAKPDPNDADIILIMDDAFRLADCPAELRGVFDHAVAQARYGASIFWARPGLLIEGSVEEFITHWQVKRDGTRRGIVEVIPVGGREIHD